VNRAYMDNLSATPVRPEVMAAMQPYFSEEFGNPSVVYDLGSRALAALDTAREQVATLVGAEAQRVVFTSSGAESNNMAVKGAALANRKKGNRVIVAGTEHHSVLNSARFLERLDYEATFLPVDENGVLAPERLAKAIDDDTVLVSVAHATREIGTMQPIAALAAVAHDAGAYFHSDAVASAGQEPLDVEALGVDLLSLSAGPLEGPKGVGALYVRKNVRLMPLVHGGIQERGLRAGTENLPGIVGMGKAAELALAELPHTRAHLMELRKRLVSGVLEAIPAVVHTGHPDKRLAGHASFCFEAIEGEALIFLLAQKGIYGNTGSACASKALKVSPVLTALNLAPEVAQGSLVLTLNRLNTMDEVEQVLTELPPAVERLRSYSPLWAKAASHTAGAGSA